jgi:hypothetical protein
MTVAEAIQYIKDLPGGRRTFHCTKHQLAQEDCPECLQDFDDWQTRHVQAQATRPRFE